MNRKLRDLPAPQGLYDPAFEHDACGIGFVVNIKGEKSYSIIDDALKILENLNHRGAEGADQKSGDGAGILVQIPHDFFVRECEVLGFSLPPAGEYGVGMIFAHRYESFRKKQMETFEKIVREEGQSILGWREVPIDESIIGEAAKSIRPRIIQVFIGKAPDVKSQMDFERKLYIIRKVAEKEIIPQSQVMGSDFYMLCIRECLPPCSCGIFIWTCPTLILRQPWRWSIPASAPIRSPAGPGPIPTAILYIMGKSIRSGAISTG